MSQQPTGRAQQSPYSHPAQQSPYSHPAQQSQQPTGQQYQQSTGQQYQQPPMPRRGLEGVIPKDVQTAVEDLERLETTAEWTKNEASQRGFHQAARASNDIKNIAHLQKDLILRQSPTARTVSQCTSQAFQQSIQELGKAAQDPSLQQAVQVVQNNLDAVQQSIQRVGQFTQQQQPGMATRTGVQ